jgi:hypothetical protein
MIIYVAIITLILFINYTAYQYQEWFGNQERFLRGICYQFLILQVGILCLLAAANSSSAIRDEVSGKSYDFFRILPISAGKKAVGILVGKNLVVLLLAAINFLFIIIFGILGHVSAVFLEQTFLALVSVALLANSVALLSSIKPVSTKKKNYIAIVIVFCLFVVPSLIRFVTMSIRRFYQIESVLGKFYTIEIPILILTSLVSLYFSCWAIKGILRRFTREDEPLFTRIGAYLFMLGFEFVLFGLFYSHLKDGARRTNYWYWLVSLLPVLLVPIWSCRSFEKYLEHSGLIRFKSATNKDLVPRILLHSNVLFDFGLFAIWTAGSIFTIFLTGQELLQNLYNIFILFSFYLFLVLLLELYVVYKPVSNKIGLLLSFIAIVYIILPLIISGILESEVVYMHSLLGFAYCLLFNRSDPSISIQIGIWLVNATLCIIPIILTWKRYQHILAARRKM